MLIMVSFRPCEIGSSLIKYFPSQSWSFIRGEVCEISEDHIHGDFGDWIISFPKSEIFYTIDTLFGEEHYATLSDGTIIKDYRRGINEAQSQ